MKRNIDDETGKLLIDVARAAYAVQTWRGTRKIPKPVDRTPGSPSAELAQAVERIPKSLLNEPRGSSDDCADCRRFEGSLRGEQQRVRHLQRNIQRLEEGSRYPGQWIGMAEENRELKRKNGRLYKERAALCRLLGLPVAVWASEEDVVYRAVKRLLDQALMEGAP